LLQTVKDYVLVGTRFKHNFEVMMSLALLILGLLLMHDSCSLFYAEPEEIIDRISQHQDNESGVKFTPRAVFALHRFAPKTMLKYAISKGVRWAQYNKRKLITYDDVLHIHDHITLDVRDIGFPPERTKHIYVGLPREREFYNGD